MESKFPKRKPNRLENFDYGAGYSYFITICTKDRAQILSSLSTVGTGVPDCPKTELTCFGEIADKYIKQLDEFYDNISIDYYAIMPNHIHMLITVYSDENGQSGTPVPTRQNTVLSRFVSTFKRFCNKEYGFNPWQGRFHDHVIRNRNDYEEISKYIYENPLNWETDEFYN